MAKNIEDVNLDSPGLVKFLAQPRPLWRLSSKKVIITGMQKYLKDISNCVGNDRSEYKSILNEAKKDNVKADINEFRKLVTAAEREYVSHVSRNVSKIILAYSKLQENSAVDAKTLTAARADFMASIQSPLSELSTGITCGPNDRLAGKIQNFDYSLVQVYNYYRTHISNLDKSVIRNCIFVIIGDRNKKLVHDIGTICDIAIGEEFAMNEISTSDDLAHFLTNDFKFDVSNIKEDEYCWSPSVHKKLADSFTHINNGFEKVLKNDVDCPFMIQICYQEFKDFSRFYMNNIECIESLVSNYRDQTEVEDVRSRIGDLIADIVRVGDEYINKLKDMGLTKSAGVVFHDSWKDLRDILMRSLDEVQSKTCNLFSDKTILYKKHPESHAFKNVYEILIPIKLVSKKVLALFSSKSVYIKCNENNWRNNIVEYGKRIKKEKLLLDTIDLQPVYALPALLKDDTGNNVRLKEVRDFGQEIERKIEENRLNSTNTN